MHYVDAMCVLNICSSLALFPPSMWPTLIISFKLLSSWSEKDWRKPVREPLWIYLGNSELYVTINRFISVCAQSLSVFPRCFLPALFLCRQCFSLLALSVSLKAADVASLSRCFEFIGLQSCLFPNSHTVNIYRGVSSLLPPQIGREANTLA